MKPSSEQLAAIRGESAWKFGDPEEAFRRWGHPEDRVEASDLLKRVNEAQIEREERLVEPKKTCNACGVEKSVSDFYKNQGKCKPCYNAAQKARKTGKPAVPKPAAPKPVEVPAEPAWVDTFAAMFEEDRSPRLSELADPKLSVLRQLTALLNSTFDRTEWSIDDAALLAEGLAELEIA